MTESHQFENLVICTGADSSGFSCLMTDCVPDLSIVPAVQCFPLYTYEFRPAEDTADMFNDQPEDTWYRYDAGVGTGVPLFALYHFPDAENMVTHH